MARAQQRPSGGAPLTALLRAERFRLGARASRVQASLEAHGGTADERAAAWIGADLPPHGAPSVTLGPARGTLGPYSFGFLDNLRGIAAYAGALPALPRRGSVALVCGRREALPEVAPLAIAGGLGVSWIISVGDGDPTEVLAFLAADAATRLVLIAAPTEASAMTALGGKRAVLLGGDPLARAAARRAGGAAVDDVEAWLAHGALLAAGARPERPVAVVVGGGATVLAEAARAAGLHLPITHVEDEDPEEVAAAIADAGGDLLLLSGATAPASPPSLLLDLGHAERVRALCRALAVLVAPPEPPIPRVRAEREQARAIADEAGADLSDHQIKRVLKCYGARVSRQAPASSSTAAARVAAQLGFPVDVVAGAQIRRAGTAAELRRFVAVLLDEAPFVLVREAFAPSPRARLLVRRERGLGLYAEVDRERALLPLERADAILLARAASGDDGRPLIDLLARATSAATDLDLTMDLDLFLGDDPAVVAATARR
ncbi:MAG: hypothetical protein EXR72_24030 [Myxococcales bacterium]|nr:hypothetical protein [Myxococcales bacterium]